MTDQREAHGPTARVAPGVGDGWRGLVARLLEEVLTLDSDAEVRAGVGPEGLLQLRISSTVIDRSTRKDLCAAFESRAQRVCETCGEAGRMRSGVMLAVSCEDCADV